VGGGGREGGREVEREEEDEKRKTRKARDNEGTGKGTIDFVNAGVIRAGLRNAAQRAAKVRQNIMAPLLSPPLPLSPRREGEEEEEEKGEEGTSGEHVLPVKKNDEGEGHPCGRHKFQVQL